VSACCSTPAQLSNVISHCKRRAAPPFHSDSGVDRVDTCDIRAVVVLAGFAQFQDRSRAPKGIRFRRAARQIASGSRIVNVGGSHTIERCEEVTGDILHAVFNAIFDQKVSLEGMLLKPNMIISGMKCTKQASVEEVALATVRCLSRHVPAAVPGIVFLSGGQNHLVATEHLSAINQIDGPKPWKLSFSYGRALQDEALKVWCGKNENLKVAQEAFYHRAKCDSAAALGKYSAVMERQSAAA
jgi:hypothetical protein